MTEVPFSVRDALNDGPTPPLRDFVTAYELDDNLVWRLGAGHLVNLLEEALDELAEPAKIEHECPACGAVTRERTSRP